VGESVGRDDQVVDLRGERLLPGLVNAHDHLHRNHYPRLRYRARYANADQWAADIDARRATEAVLIAGAAVPRAEQFLLGGLKNLLSGATTVAHHDARSAELDSSEFPVQVLSRYGWAHSLSMDGAARVRESHGATPADAPWFIHAGEGTDAAAADEAAQLADLGVLGDNTVLVHGLGFDTAARARLIRERVGLVWCPSSNDFLYGRSAPVNEFARAGLLALGSDSRLSGARDLLDELQFARGTGAVDDSHLEALVALNGARLLRAPDRGVLRAGAAADLIVLPRDSRLWELRRADLRCVMTRGVMRCGDRDYSEAMPEPRSRVPAALDGRPKWLDQSLVAMLRELSIQEPGLELRSEAARAA
jgi:cytosine/adenosine deaminase-related metal-dependent hydrolase